MPNTDPLRRLAIALVAILGADLTLQGAAYFNRATDLLNPFEDGIVNPPLPRALYTLVGFGETAGSGRAWRGTVQLDAFADGNDARERAESILERMVVLLTATAFTGQGLDAAPIGLVRRFYPGVEREQTRRLQRASLELDLELHP